MKKIIVFMLVVSMVFTLAGCTDSQGNGNDKNGDVDLSEVPLSEAKLRLGSGPSGAVYYIMGGAMADVANRNTEMDVTSIATTASIENNRLLAQKRIEIGMTTPDLAYYAYKGEEMYPEPTEDLRFLFSGHKMYTTVIAKEGSDINSLSDLKGKKVGVGDLGSAVYTCAQTVLGVGGLTMEDVDRVHLSQGEMKDGIVDGSLDAAVLVAGLPHPSVLEAATVADIKILEIPEQGLIDYLDSASPAINAAFDVGVLPAGTYPGFDEDIGTALFFACVLSREDVPEEMIYEFVKAIMENNDQMGAAHPSGFDYHIDRAVDLMNIPIHPGAEKYYKEVGIID